MGGVWVSPATPMHVPLVGNDVSVMMTAMRIDASELLCDYSMVAQQPLDAKSTLSTSVELPDVPEPSMLVAQDVNNLPAHFNSTSTRSQTRRDRRRRNLFLAIQNEDEQDEKDEPKVNRLKVGDYCGVKLDSCKAETCQVYSRKMGEVYSKCHCKVVASDTSSDGTDYMLLVQHVGNDDLQEWMSSTDDRIIRSKAETYCRHGRICNYMVRKDNCVKHSKEAGASDFCHARACIEATERRILLRSPQLVDPR